MLFHIQFNRMFTQTTREVDQGSPLRKIEGSPMLFQGVQHRISGQKLRFCICRTLLKSKTKASEAIKQSTDLLKSQKFLAKMLGPVSFLLFFSTRSQCLSSTDIHVLKPPDITVIVLFIMVLVHWLPHVK